ncbi:hypothetical protein A3A67_04065 [Candidatus Peribacteria bacterium RIFCSPLOWO2_01_FULL_51_18]|nr:MAG: hypothetical protein A3C52_04255 [Candidatus Peribacteria bacterium RIFCSPHIGHO2_02_FULL_51_15]OGJ65800.1 MAG: hypothetical protein A3A67_04065 [Candidatus Peribacteria bacterium RIFCSPLOWO2_01_FULL_51_18]OGJ68327.1 MAG: hypothetical protein A3J34_03360 [Candidatus Peribacteria bacterium RIFCSPLOWO2_02_FULL_51_10]
MTIWLTVGIQLIFLYVIFKSANGNFFGYTRNETIGFFGIALLASGIAQSTVIGVVRNLRSATWSGEFDQWLLHPPNILLRIIIEDLGLVWYWPHILIGPCIILWFFPVSFWFISFIAAVIASTIEMAIILILCMPSIRWGRWDPYESVWEYLENARSIPVGRSKSFMLWLASFGVLQYSLALEVITGKLSLLILLLVSIGMWTLVFLFLRFFLHSYSSASS